MFPYLGAISINNAVLDIVAGYYAKRMGLPIDHLIVATNANDILHRYLPFYVSLFTFFFSPSSLRTGILLLVLVWF